MLKECAIFKEDSKEEADWDWESHLAEIARSAPDEFEDLVKMYYKADLSLYKIRLADTLVLLNYREIIPDLIRLLNCNHEDFEFFISLTLVNFNEEAGALHLIKLHNQNSTEYNYRYLTSEMYEYKTDIAKKYRYLFTKLNLTDTCTKKIKS